MKPQLFNKATLGAWAEVDSMNWRTLVKQIAQIFLEVSPAQFQELNRYRSEGNLDGIRTSAHALKSSCGNVGAEEAQQLLNSVEQAAMAKDLPRALTLIDQVQPVYQESRLRLDEYVKSIYDA